MSDKYIILGGGLSGTILAWQFYFNNIDFTLIDNNQKNTSSRIAAGLYNPIVFKRLTHSWLAPKLIPYLNEFYDKVEKELKIKVHTKRNILRIINSENDIDLWKKRSYENDFIEFMDSDIISNYHPKIINNNLGLAKVKNAGNLNTELFLNKSHNYFNLLNKYKKEDVPYSDLDWNKNIIFSEGYISIENPWFGWLPFNLVKGEILKIKIKNYPINDVINKSVFILPVGNNEFICGSTYRWEQINKIPTQEEKDYLISHLDNILKVDYKILDHWAGIRPAVLDRRPLIGTHPKRTNFHIFNGMGSKAVMLAPYLSDNFVKYLTRNEELIAESNINRYLKYYNN